jgi:succinate dehydrogenase / fumarate reductase cytochrome b subunit
MTWQQLFTSSIGKKFIMAFSGIFLILFLVIHVGINACIFANDGGEIFNKAAHFMGSMILIRILEYGLFAGFLLHIIQGLVLWYQNSRTRNVGYAVKFGSRGSTWYSRSMGLLGTIVLLFLILHLSAFWVKARFTQQDIDPIAYANTGEMHNMYKLMLGTFSVGWVVVAYVIGCASLAYHLLHGFKSAFRTLGMSNRKYIGLVKGIGVVYSIAVPLVFALMPLAVYFKWID